MKKRLRFLFFALCLILPAGAGSTLNIGQQVVYVCLSQEAKVYHFSRECRGLRNRKHPLKQTTVEYARQKQWKRGCKLCTPSAHWNR